MSKPDKHALKEDCAAVGFDYPLPLPGTPEAREFVNKHCPELIMDVKTVLVNPDIKDWEP